MKVNWSVRFKNKTWLASFIALIVSMVYQILSMFGVTASVDQDSVMQLASLILTVLAGVGVIQDPTTAGLSDSNRALGYTVPNDDSDEGVG